MNKIKRLLALLLTFAIFTTPFSSASFAAVVDTGTVKTLNVSKAGTYKDAELERAVSLGIGAYHKNNSTVTYAEYFKMLDVAVKLADKSVLSVWKKKFKSARVSPKKMHRDEGMLATFFAAKTIGKEYGTTNGDWSYYSNKIGENIWEGTLFDYPLLTGWNKAVKLDEYTWDNYMIAATFYSIGRISKFSDELLFDYDKKLNSMRNSANFTYEEALLAALRLYDSGIEVKERIVTKQDAQILNNAEDRKNTILNSKTSVIITGTSYYVSNLGNDENDGLSPETAWATIDKVNEMEFNDGDGVFFERGGFFRGQIFKKDNMTYSAYGEGDKPKIVASPENGADPEKWTLLPGTRNIWVYHMDMYDTGGIVFNEGDSWAERKTGLWNGKEYVEPADQKSKIKIKKLDNLEFYNPIDYSGYTTDEAIVDLDKKGKLYLRCDEGNPGKVYNSIEFMSNPVREENGGSVYIVCLGKNSIADNLCCLYSTQAGIRTYSGAIVQNCEVGWIGGTVSWFSGALLGCDVAAVIRCGDGIFLGESSDSAALNNYVHHTYDNGITIETGAWCTEEERYSSNIKIIGNLVEACSGDIAIADWAALANNSNKKILYKNIMIEDNYLMKSGYGWSHLEPNYDWGIKGQENMGNCSLYFGYPDVTGKNINVKNNVFYLGKYALIGGKNSSEVQQYKVNFSGNTYVQNTSGILAEWATPGINTHSVKYHFNLNAENTVRNILGDKTGVILTPQY